MPKVPYPYQVNWQLVTGNGSLTPICSLSKRTLSPSLTVYKNILWDYIYIFKLSKQNSSHQENISLNLRNCRLVTWSNPRTHRCPGFPRSRFWDLVYVLNFAPKSALVKFWRQNENICKFRWTHCVHSSMT